MSYNFSEKEKAILSIVQENLPDTATPYADIAQSVGCTEDQVINLLKRLVNDGAIRRFGASIKHQKTGWNSNAMVAWIASEHEVEACGRKAASHNNISHCYYRPSSASDWPYTLYTMIHGRSDDECKQVIAEVQTLTGLKDYAVLDSIKELKKTSMKYF